MKREPRIEVLSLISSYVLVTASNILMYLAFCWVLEPSEVDIGNPCIFHSTWDESGILNLPSHDQISPKLQMVKAQGSLSVCYGSLAHFSVLPMKKMVMFHRYVELPEGKTGPRSAVCQRANPHSAPWLFFRCGVPVIASRREHPWTSVLPFFDVRQYLHISGSTANWLPQMSVAMYPDDLNLKPEL